MPPLHGVETKTSQHQNAAARGRVPRFLRDFGKTPRDGLEPGSNETPARSNLAAFRLSSPVSPAVADTVTSAVDRQWLDTFAANRPRHRVILPDYTA